MGKILAIAHYTTLENLRNKIYHVIVLFGFFMLGASVLLGVLAVEEEHRLIFDLGLGAIELFGLVTAVFGSVTLVLEEMESRALYMIITRPLKRYQYLLGRAGGLWMSVLINVAVMGAGHIALLAMKGWVFDMRYLPALFLIFLKIILISSLALFFSLFSSSTLSSVVFTFFFWVMGHFGPELKFLAEKAQSAAVSVILQAAFVLMPNLQFFNLRDTWNVSGQSLWEGLAQASAYGALYTTACLLLTIVLFRKKEF